MTTIFALKTAGFFGTILRGDMVMAQYTITGKGRLMKVREAGGAPATAAELKLIRPILRKLDMRWDGRHDTNRVELAI